jgi:hemerythrin
MAYCVWMEDLNTGIDVIDGQHRRIVDYINQLHEARLRNDMDAVGEVIEAAVDYTISHFGFEETLMEEAGYGFTRAHKKVHELFIKRVSEFQLRFKAGEDISAELHSLLVKWLFSHIRNDDADYVGAVRSLVGDLKTPRRAGWLSRSLSRFFGRA